MNRLTWVVVGVSLVLSTTSVTAEEPNSLSAQTSTVFGTCAFWQEWKPDPSKPSTVDIRRTYRLGFAAGYTFGLIGDLPREPASDPRWALVQNRFDEGLVEALQRPAFLVDAFDQKCGDYRNRRLLPSDMGLLILLEVGGVSSQRIEQALEIMRTGGDSYKARALKILLVAP
jgi:hypothetical protein